MSSRQWCAGVQIKKYTLIFKSRIGRIDVGKRPIRNLTVYGNLDLTSTAVVFPDLVGFIEDALEKLERIAGRKQVDGLFPISLARTIS